MSNPCLGVLLSEAKDRSFGVFAPQDDGESRQPPFFGNGGRASSPAAVSVLLSLVLSLSTAAQVRENVTVELIEVPVYVTAPDGQPIRGLTKEAFELRVNGRVHPIDYFEAIDFGAQHVREATPRPARERRLYLLLFDEYFSIPAKLARAQRAAEELVEKSDRETDLFAVATYTAHHGVQFATPFVSDRGAVQRALHTLSVSGAHDPLGLAMSPVERAAWIASPTLIADNGFREGNKGDAADAEIAETIRGGAAFQELVLDEPRHRISDFLLNFADLAGRLAGLEGQKHLLYFSSGFPTALMHGGDSPVPSSPTSGGGLDAGITADFSSLCRSFARAGVFIDAVDIDGIRHNQGKITPFNSDESLQLVSHGTGGTYVHNRNDFAQALADLTAAQQVVYVLAFNRHDNRSGTIRVKVNGVPRATRLSYRQGFGNGTPSKEVDPLQLADILIHDVPQTGMTLKLSTTLSELTLVLPREEITPQLADGMPYVDTLLYVFDEHGSAIIGMEKRVDAAGPLVIREALHLPPGRYVAKAVAHIAGTTSLGFARTEFTIE